jgi:hypothetical protein
MNPNKLIPIYFASSSASSNRHSPAATDGCWCDSCLLLRLYGPTSNQGLQCITVCTTGDIPPWWLFMGIS